MKTLIRLLLGAIALIGVCLVGGYFALKRGDIPYTTLETRYAAPDSRFADLPSGVRVHYRIQGKADGPTILLIHGYGVNLETWAPWVKTLGGEYRFVTLDLPGHGLTRAPDAYAPSIAAFSDLIEEFAAATGLTRFAVGGNSMGGQVAWVFALRHPERVDSLILVDAGGWDVRADAASSKSGGDRNPPLVFQLISNPTLAPLLATLDPKPLLRSGLRAAYADKTLVTDAMTSRYADLARAPGHRRILGAIELNQGADPVAGAASLAAIKVPTLIMWGEKDALIPVADAHKFASAIAGSTLIVYPGIGHLPHEEAAAKSAVDLKAFFDGKTLAGAALIGPDARGKTP